MQGLLANRLVLMRCAARCAGEIATAATRHARGRTASSEAGLLAIHPSPLRLGGRSDVTKKEPRAVAEGLTFFAVSVEACSGRESREAVPGRYCFKYKCSNSVRLGG